MQFESQSLLAPPSERVVVVIDYKPALDLLLDIFEQTHTCESVDDIRRHFRFTLEGYFLPHGEEEMRRQMYDVFWGLTDYLEQGTALAERVGEVFELIEQITRNHLPRWNQFKNGHAIVDAYLRNDFTLEIELNRRHYFEDFHGHALFTQPGAAYA